MKEYTQKKLKSYINPNYTQLKYVKTFENKPLITALWLPNDSNASSEMDYLNTE